MIEGAEVQQAPSVRDVVEAAVTEHESAEKPKRDVSDRARDEGGRFEKKGPEAKPQVKPEAKPETKPEAAPAPVYAAPKMPQSLGPDFQPHWEKLPKEVHDRWMKREADFAKGVSTYKTEYDRLKPLGEALKPYEQLMQQTGMTPQQIMQAAMASHNTFSVGSKEQKLRELARYVRDYQIPLHEMLVQGEDGKVYFNQQYFQQQEQPRPQGITPEEVDKRVQAGWLAMERQRQMTEFLNAKDKDGTPLYPHFETVRQTMDGILRAGLAKDLPSAYRTALRHPDHSDLYEAMEKQRRDTEEAAKVAAAAEAARKAKANVVSPKPRTPTGTAGNGGAKTLRETIESAVDEHSR